MKYISTLTSKGQTTIPAQVRSHLNLDIGDQIEYELSDDGSNKSVIIKNITLFRDLKETFREVLRRSKEYGLICDKDKRGITILSDISSDENEEWRKYRIQFGEYLRSLEFDTFKIIQIIMYLGRNEDYDKDDSSIEIYKKLREHFDNDLGWNTQEIEVNQLLGKGGSLYGYLLNGFRILKIDVY